MTLEDEVAALRAENALLRAELAAAQARIAELEKRKTPVPGFVKANTERKDRAEPRKKRAPEHNAGRRRAEPTQTVQHAYERCPDCGYLLRGQSIARLRDATAAERASLLAQARASPVAHMDETGWREDGQNGCVWGVTTPGPQAVRYYHYDHSHAGAVATDLLGDFDGHLSTDFSGAYNAYGGKHQRCWTHLLRDLHDLKRAQADNAAVRACAQDVRARYDEAQGARRGPLPLTAPQREALYRPWLDRAPVLGMALAGAAN